jgi:membrane protein
MSARDAPGRIAVIPAPPKREPLWAIGLSALLVALGRARRDVDPGLETVFDRMATLTPPPPLTGGRGSRRGGEANPRTATRQGRAFRGLTEGSNARGWFAQGPSEIPALGWKDILLRVYNGIIDDRILANAAGVTYYALLALFPGIAAVVSIYGLFADPNSIVGQVDTMAGFAPGGAIDVIRDQLTRLSAQGSTKLGVSFLIGLVISLWSANSGIRALFDSLNVVYEEEEKRSFIRLNAVTLSFTIATIAFLLIALACVIAFPPMLSHLSARGMTGQLLNIARWPILLVLVAFGLTLIYRYGPSRTEPRWQWITWGSAFAAVIWLAASGLFSWYAANFESFNKTYGSLGAIIGFMTWMWVSTIVVLVGAKLNAEIEHQTVRESTVGPPKPLGRRGATMADTIGPAQA